MTNQVYHCFTAILSTC